MRKKRENERKREKKREKERKRERKGEKEKYVQGQLLSICIQFSKRETRHIGRNARNLKNWPGSIKAHYHY